MSNHLYPSLYHVAYNRCRCHPETCCCNDYAVIKPSGTTLMTTMHHSVAVEVAEALNVFHKLKPLPQ